MIHASKRSRITSDDRNNSAESKKHNHLACFGWDNNLSKLLIVGYLRNITNELNYRYTINDIANMLFQYYVLSYTVDNIAVYNQNRVSLSLKQPANIQSKNTLKCRFKTDQGCNLADSNKSTILFKPMINDIFKLNKNCQNSHTIGIKLNKHACEYYSMHFDFSIVCIHKEISNRFDIVHLIENWDDNRLHSRFDDIIGCFEDVDVYAYGIYYSKPKSADHNQIKYKTMTSGEYTFSQVIDNIYHDDDSNNLTITLSQNSRHSNDNLYTFQDLFLLKFYFDLKVFD